MKALGQTLTSKDLVHIIPRLIIIIIIGQTLPFKYLGADESIWIFTQMGWEPWGRYMIAIIETVAIILLISRWYIVGAIITLSIISAANFMHFTRLGFNINGDGGLLFGLSVAVVICSLMVVIHWNKMRTKKYTKHFDFTEISDKRD
ncbi:MAG: DoxX family protein [Ekhidna sp.]|nr:DoxX family protein [Ekhidna sp.]MBC6410233.1 DoxX family protein [Ekhidna sp.]MBC6426218.1 DoxX family protein [Ekhidna sp.]